MISRSVLVINPNSSPSVTEAIGCAAASIRLPGVEFVTKQLDSGPAVIESDEEHQQAAEALVESIVALAMGHNCVIIACHGDPGLVKARQAVSVPVLGIGETSMLAAAAATRSFGVLTLGPDVVPRKWRQLRATGIQNRCIAVEPTETGVLHAMNKNVDLTPYVMAARSAIAKGADVLVLGCAGMVSVHERLTEVVDTPVVEPVLAACLTAAGLLGSFPARVGHNPFRPPSPVA
jgi:allantoin racemase